MQQSHLKRELLSRLVSGLGFVFVGVAIPSARGQWVRAAIASGGVLLALSGMFVGNMTQFALARYRVTHVDKSKLGHFLLLTAALLFGLLAHVVELEGKWLVGVVLALLFMECWLFSHDYHELTKTSDPNLIDQYAFGELNELLKREDTEFADEFHYYQELEVRPTSGSRIEGVLRSSAIDQWIQVDDPRIEISPPTLKDRGNGYEYKLLKSHALTLAAAFELFLVRQRENGNPKRTNDAKIALCTDLARRPTKIAIARTSYFTSFVTNDASTERIMRQHRGATTVYEDLTSLYPITRGPPAKVLGIGESELSNHLGASTIAVIQQQSDDQCFLLFPIQSHLAMRSSGLYAPTGSGSLDWQDYERCKRSGSTDLLSLIRYGVQRELCEEQSLIKSGSRAGRLQRTVMERSIETRVLGYFRWMSVGGLPQFCCVSTMKVPSLSVLQPSEDELEGKGVSGHLPQNAHSISSLKELGAECGRMLDTQTRNLSVPLAVNLSLIRSTIAGEYGPIARSNFIHFLSTNIPGVAWL